MLAGSQVIGEPDSVPFTFSCNRRRVELSIAPDSLQRRSATVEAWWDLARTATRNESTPVSALAPAMAPLYLKHPEVYYWYEHLPERGILHLQYNRAQEMRDGPRLSAFRDELLRQVGRDDVHALVIDLRFNTGGNLDLATPLMQSLHEAVAGKPVYVITGRSTFSAGITHAAQWKRWDAKVVGEPVGDELDVGQRAETWNCRTRS